MESVLKKFKLKKTDVRESEARQKLQRELFAFNKCVDHGFPNKPSALAYDPKLKIVAVGTRNGFLKVYGSPGVEFCGKHQGEDSAVSAIYFLRGEGRLITLCADNSLHLWEIEECTGKSASFMDMRHLYLDSMRLKDITVCCLSSTGKELLVGTECGNIHILNVYSFQLTDHVIQQDTIIQNVPDDFKVNPGAVECLKRHPMGDSKYLIGYNRGLIVLWDSKENSSLYTYNASQQLEYITCLSDGSEFISAHADGSYMVWSTTDCRKPKEQGNTPYGPFACKAINKIEWKTAKAGTLIIFSGGMPRASCGDRYTVSIMQGDQHVVLDFSSRVVDFVTLNSSEEHQDGERSRYDEPHTLLVLAEEEIVAIDLLNEAWPVLRAPYLYSIHASAITCAQHVSNIPDLLISKLIDIGDTQFNSYSQREWPITGGNNLMSFSNCRDLLLTGHEDGSVRFWDASTPAMSLIYKLSTAYIFGFESPSDQSIGEEEDWPPFRKVGMFDPYSDDPRLGIQKIVFCPLSGALVIGGTAGQVIVLQFEREEQEFDIKVCPVHIIDNSDGFVWKGHDALHVRENLHKYSPGFQPSTVMQLYPPAAITSLALHSQWQLVSVGTAHGLCVLDYAQKTDLLTKCTLNPLELTGNAASTPRRKSFKKSLRESFRRLRRGRSERKHKSKNLDKLNTSDTRSGGDMAAGAGKLTIDESNQGDSPKPVERQVESREKTDDGMISMVRCLHFADTYLVTGQSHTPTLWAGTNAGTVLIYQITVPLAEKRDSQAVQCILAKEIQLQHRAPVIALGVTDRHAQPLPGPFEVENERVKAADMSGGHHVIVASEEQLKIFSLPSLKPNNKYKLTAHEGAQFRKVAFANFRSRSDERYSENDLACLTNLGDVHIFTVTQLRRQMKQKCISSENISGIASCIFTQNGEGFFLSSPSEFTRFSISVRHSTLPQCNVQVSRPDLAIQTSPGDNITRDIDVLHFNQTSYVAEQSASTTSEPSREDGPSENSITANQSVLSDDDIRVHVREQCTVTATRNITQTVVTETVHSETQEAENVTNEVQNGPS